MVSELADTAASGVLVCRGCGAGHPVLDGAVPIIMRDPSGVLAFPGTDAEWPPPTDAWCEQLASADPSTAAFREAWLLATFLVGHHPASAPNAFVADALSDHATLRELLSSWLATHAPAGAPARELDALEVGCGPGGFAPLWLEATEGEVHLIELRPASLRVGRQLLHDGRVTVPWRRYGRRFEAIEVTTPPVDMSRLRFAVADALDPPFPAERFGLVAALAVVDVVRDPWMLLGQLDALTAPGGLILLAQPFHYEHHVQPSDGWLDGPDGLRAALGGQLDGLEHLDYEVLEETDGVPWGLPAHDRLVHRFSLHVVLARKRQG